MWRCFSLETSCSCHGEIFSTYVEVFPNGIVIRIYRIDFLHVCGGVSMSDSYIVPIWKFSPRMWRCFRYKTPFCKAPEIFSTYVEVFPIKSNALGKLFHFLHVCGGVSLSKRKDQRCHVFSPRMWRCFFGCRHCSDIESIFSTYVEVFPRI